MKSKTNNIIFKGLTIIAWIIFIGLCIEAGSLILNFIFSLSKPEYAQNLHQKLDLTSMYQNNIGAFFGMFGFVLMIAILKAQLFYVVIRLIHKIDLTKPFNTYVSKKILQMSYYTLSIGLLSHVAKEVTKNLYRRGYNIDTLNQFWSDSQAFILMAAVVYVIAIIFSKGVEYQEELEDTV